MTNSLHNLPNTPNNFSPLSNAWGQHTLNEEALICTRHRENPSTTPDTTKQNKTTQTNFYLQHKTTNKGGPTPTSYPASHNSPPRLATQLSLPSRTQQLAGNATQIAHNHNATHHPRINTPTSHQSYHPTSPLPIQNKWLLGGPMHQSHTNPQLLHPLKKCEHT